MHPPRWICPIPSHFSSPLHSWFLPRPLFSALFCGGGLFCYLRLKFVVCAVSVRFCLCFRPFFGVWGVSPWSWRGLLWSMWCLFLGFGWSLCGQYGVFVWFVCVSLCSFCVVSVWFFLGPSVVLPWSPLGYCAVLVWSWRGLGVVSAWSFWSIPCPRGI